MSAKHFDLEGLHHFAMDKVRVRCGSYRSCSFGIVSSYFLLSVNRLLYNMEQVMAETGGVDLLKDELSSRVVVTSLDVLWGGAWGKLTWPSWPDVQLCKCEPSYHILCTQSVRNGGVQSVDWTTGLDYWTHISPQKCIVPRLLESGNHPNFVKVSPRQAHPPGWMASSILFHVAV